MPVDASSASIEVVFQRLTELESAGLIGRCAIGGAFSFIYYAEPFETGDLDVFALFPSESALINLAPIYEHLRNLGYAAENEQILIEGVPVQILPATGPLVDEATPLDRAALESILLRHGLLARWRKFEESARG